MSEPRTKAGRALLAVLPARYGGAALDPVSSDLTLAAILAIEAEARQPYEDVLWELVKASEAGADTYEVKDIVKKAEKLLVGPTMIEPIELTEEESALWQP